MSATETETQEKKNILELVQKHSLQDVTVVPIDAGGWDLSITRHLIGLWVACAVVLIFFLLVARSQRRGGIENPGKFTLLGEMLVGFVRDTMVRPFLGTAADRFFPYLATVFFVLLVANLMGRIPVDFHPEFHLSHYMASPTANFAFTSALTLVSFVLALGWGMYRHNPVMYWFSFVPSAVPMGLKPIIWFFEFLSIFIRNIALTVRLFANIAGGHIVSFVILYLIVQFAGQGAGWVEKSLITPLSVLFSVALSFLELLVAALQAYVFVLLTAIFIGMSGEKH